MYMKKISIIAILLTFVINLFSFSVVDAAVRISGYYRKSGTYVQSYYRTSPNYTKLDNYSTKGNHNPYTGKIGTVNPYKTYKLR